MKPVSQLIAELRKLNVRLFEEDGQLRYQAPRGALNAQMLAELRERKAELLDFCRQAKADTDELPLQPVPRNGDLPIALAQRRLWLLNQVEGPNPAYNIALALRLRGELNLAALQSALAAIIRRHEPLRTAFVSPADPADEPRQRIVPSVLLPWTFIDLSDRPEALEEARRQARDEALRPFDLGRAPLARFTLWRLAEQDHVFLVNLHHIIGDGSSLEVFARELSALYAEGLGGPQADLPALGIQYADFAASQHQWLDGPTLERQLAYWRRQLEDLSPLLELPTDRPRPPQLTYTGATLPCTFEAALVDGLRRLARRQGTTPFVALVGLIAAILSRYTGRKDIPIACPASQRNRPELEPLIGFFINTLVLRIDLSGNPSFLDLLLRVKTATADAFANQDIPFDQVVETLAIERNPSYPPLAQCSAMLLNSRNTLPRLAGLDTAPFDFDNPIARYDLTLEMYEHGDTLDIFWLYNTRLFDEATVIRMARHFRNLAEAVLARPETPLAELNLLDPDERHTLLAVWSQGVGTPAPAWCVHQALERQAALTPDATALVHGEHRLSYGELNAKANRLARHLVNLGVAADRPVGLCLERSFELLIGLFAILKAGGAYVPLDPDLPAERLRLILDDAEPVLLLTQTRLAERFPGRDLLCLDALPEAVAQADPANLDRLIRGEDLAYLLYTSGSTGQPKGCALEHRQLAHYLDWANRAYYPDDTGGAFALYTAMGFDLTVTSLFLPLLRGKILHLFPQEWPLDQILRAQFAPTSGIDSVKITPAHLTLLAQLDLPATAIEVAVIGGEQVLPEHARTLWRLNPGMRLYNEYGPTEATVGCIVQQLHPEDARIRIGRPIDRMQAYVLDDALQLVPVGVSGQLYLGGAGLARGYWRQPDLTGERFITHPYRPGERLYASGDVARWGPDGTLECLGRIDQQVKLRGFRIELGEIEAALHRHPGVRQAVVVVRDNGSRGKHLVAYIGGDASPNDLRASLRNQLPDYMVPQAFVVLESLPVNRHGKIDRRALPAPAPVPTTTSGEPPRTPSEQALAAIWTQLLGLERIGIHDNFFELGGDSILSIQAASRATQVGWRLSPKQFFEHPTIAALAQVAEPAQAAPGVQELVEGPVPLTPIQHRFFEAEPAEPHHFNQALLLELYRPWSPELLERAIRALMLHHDALRLRFERDETGWRQHCEGAAWAERFAVRRTDFSDLAEAEQAAAIAAAAAQRQASLSLNRPLMHVEHFDLGSNRPARLLWIIHHLLVDGVSWRILLEDLHTACAQLEQGQPVKLPPKTSSYRQWANRLVEYAASADIREDEAFWLAETQTRTARLPVDFPSGDERLASAEVVTAALNPDETLALLLDVPSAYRTHVNDALLAALVMAFAQWTGRDWLRVDVEGHGREDLFDGLDLSRTVGWFTSITPVCLELGRDRDPGKILQAVKEQLRRVPKGGISYGVSRYLAHESALRSLPEAEVCFNYLGQVDRILPESAPLAPTGESVGPYASPSDKLRYRLTVDGEVEAGHLRFRFQYSRKSYRADTIQNLAQEFLTALRGLIAHCRAPDAGGVTPSDFPLAGLGPGQLDKLARQLRAKMN